MVAILLHSCQQKKADSSWYSNDFKPIFKKTAYLLEIYKTDEGIRYLDSAVRRIQPTYNDRFRQYAFHFRYWKSIKINDRKALLYADSMMLMAQKIKNQRQYTSDYAEASFAKGDVYFDLNQFNDAYLNYFQGYLIGKNYFNNPALSDYTYRMGMIMYKQAHFNLAARYFTESLEKNTPTTDLFADFYRRQELLDNIALSYQHAGKTDSALLFFDKALDYINNNVPRFKSRKQMLDMANGVVYGNKADVLILQGDKQGAIELLKKSIAYNLEKGNDNQDAELSEIKLGNIYYQQQKNDSLFNLLKTIRLHLDSFKNDRAEIDWNMLMSKFYARRKEPEKALKYFERYSALKDSASAGLTLLRESDVIQQFANFEKQYQINYLTGNNRQQRFYLTVAAIVGTMAVVIILLIARNWQRSKREVRIVNKLNAQITRQKISLEQTLTELSENSKEKDRILRTVAHDLRNPIGGIASLTAIMVNEDDYTPEQKELLKLIKETATDTIELINEILEATRGSEAELSRQMVDINSLLGNTVELMRFKAAEKNQQITVSLLDKPEAIFIDREKIRRVVSNLISNAIKFSTLNSVINVKVIDKGVYIEISVPDHGIGIPLNMQDKIFNIFTEAKRPGTMGEKSFGLGLSICRQIIEKHNGKIWFESHQLTGTTFFINLEKTEENMIETQTAIMRESAF